MVHVIVPTIRRYDRLAECLRLLPDGMRGIDWRLTVVDNGEGFKIWLPQFGARVKFAKPQSYARSNNFAADLRSDCDWLLLLNDDTEPSPGFCFSMLQTAQRFGASIVGARLLYPNGRAQHNGVELRGDGAPYHTDRWAVAGFEPHNCSRLVTAVTFACVLVRAELWRRLGGLDEKYEHFYEDIDFCRRAQAAGERIALAYDATLVHHHNQSLTGTEQELEMANRSLTRYLERWSK